jgi:hypothetical protein
LWIPALILNNVLEKICNTWAAWPETGMVIGVTVTTIIHKGNKNVKR